MPKDRDIPYFPFYPDDFCSDEKVEAMTTEQVGAYILLLCKAWRSKPPASIPPDDAVLARYARVTPSKWLELRCGVLDAFVLGSDGRYHQPRLRAEYDKLMAYRLTRSRSAKIAAESRWSQGLNKDQMRHACQTHSECNATRVGGGDGNSGSGSGVKEGTGKPSGGYAERPSVVDVEFYAQTIGLAPWKARDWFDEMEGGGWLDHAKRPVQDWRAVLRRVRTKWEADGRPKGPPASHRGPVVPEAKQITEEIKVKRL